MSIRSAVNYRRQAAYLLAYLGRVAETEWSRFLRSRRLTTAEFSVLALLRAGSQTQRAVADAVQVDPRNMVATVAKLTRRRLIASTAVPTDGRAKLLALTTKGERLWEDIEVRLRPKRDAFLRPLAPAEVAELERLLLKLYEGLDPGRRSAGRVLS